MIAVVLLMYPRVSWGVYILFIEREWMISRLLCNMVVFLRGLGRLVCGFALTLFWSWVPLQQPSTFWKRAGQMAHFAAPSRDISGEAQVCYLED